MLNHFEIHPVCDVAFSLLTISHHCVFFLVLIIAETEPAEPDMQTDSERANVFP